MHVRLGFSSKSALCREISIFNYNLGPIYMVSDTRDNPSPKATLRSVYKKFNIFWPSFSQVTYLTKWRTTGKKTAVNILVIACVRIFCSSCLVSGRRDKVLTFGKVVSPPPPPPPRVVPPAQDDFVTLCRQSAEFCRKIREKLARPG